MLGEERPLQSKQLQALLLCKTCLATLRLKVETEKLAEPCSRGPGEGSAKNPATLPMAGCGPI